MPLRIIYILFLLIQLLNAPVFAAEKSSLYLQVVGQPEGRVLLEFQVEAGDLFYIDYVHSSDHTPVHDIFRMDEDGIVLIEENFDWYGSGLEFLSNAGARVSLSGDKTRVFLHRECPRLLLRVGRVAGHVITYKDSRTPLLSIARGGDSVWIRLVKKGRGE
ncbi:MAG: DUF1850 domain-containing protein [Deltaproteobacteria bacterium]|nr:DUF1850 domain-containing protein [Deltaproteobacteria bacterium]MBW2595846.1 DUF1850 domain-containing protein [Deltaproteobacteria bacterium]MBW2651341.1 DUF1850 domain-containing protein [Deltaproteobacteria bacterium]